MQSGSKIARQTNSVVLPKVDFSGGDSHFRGVYTSESDLQEIIGNPGDYAYVDEGPGYLVVMFIWNSSEQIWIQQQGTSTSETPESIKQKYESNVNTNAYTDDEKIKLAQLKEHFKGIFINEISLQSIVGTDGDYAVVKQDPIVILYIWNSINNLWIAISGDGQSSGEIISEEEALTLDYNDIYAIKNKTFSGESAIILLNRILNTLSNPTENYINSDGINDNPDKYGPNTPIKPIDPTAPDYEEDPSRPIDQTDPNSVVILDPSVSNPDPDNPIVIQNPNLEDNTNHIGYMFGVGINENNEFGYGVLNNVSYFTLTFNEKIKDISNNLVIKENGKLYVQNVVYSTIYSNYELLNEEHNWKQVIGSSSNYMVLSEDGDLYCYGENYGYSFGIGDIDNVDVLTKVNNDKWLYIIGGLGLDNNNQLKLCYVYGIKSDGKLYVSGNIFKDYPSDSTPIGIGLNQITNDFNGSNVFIEIPEVGICKYINTYRNYNDSFSFSLNEKGEVFYCFNYTDKLMDGNIFSNNTNGFFLKANMDKKFKYITGLKYKENNSLLILAISNDDILYGYGNVTVNNLYFKLFNKKEGYYLFEQLSNLKFRMMSEFYCTTVYNTLMCCALYFITNDGYLLTIGEIVDSDNYYEIGMGLGSNVTSINTLTKIDEHQWKYIKFNRNGMFVFGDFELTQLDLDRIGFIRTDSLEPIVNSRYSQRDYGYLYMSGANNNGQLGLGVYGGTYDDKLYKVPIGLWVMVSSPNESYRYAIDKDGYLYFTGLMNFDGISLDGTLTNIINKVNIFTKIGNSRWLTMDEGYYFIREDGYLFNKSYNKPFLEKVGNDKWKHISNSTGGHNNHGVAIIREDGYIFNRYTMKQLSPYKFIYSCSIDGYELAISEQGHLFVRYEFEIYEPYIDPFFKIELSYDEFRPTDNRKWVYASSTFTALYWNDALLLLISEDRSLYVYDFNKHTYYSAIEPLVKGHCIDVSGQGNGNIFYIKDNGALYHYKPAGSFTEEIHEIVNTTKNKKVFVTEYNTLSVIGNNDNFTYGNGKLVENNNKYVTISNKPLPNSEVIYDNFKWTEDFDEIIFLDFSNIGRPTLPEYFLFNQNEPEIPGLEN